jgi:hypothetical protein
MKKVFNSIEEEEAYKELVRQKNSERSSLWQKQNREKAYITHKKYTDKNREILNEKARIYRAENKEERLSNRRRWAKEKRIKDPLFKFTENVRALIWLSFNRYIKRGHKPARTQTILGCDIDFFVNYILSKCPEGTTLEDFGARGYHIDHIIPISSAKTEEEVLKLCHYTNFQPLFWLDNIRKSNKT